MYTQAHGLHAFSKTYIHTFSIFDISIYHFKNSAKHRVWLLITFHLASIRFLVLNAISALDHVFSLCHSTYMAMQCETKRLEDNTHAYTCEYHGLPFKKWMLVERLPSLNRIFYRYASDLRSLFPFACLLARCMCSNNISACLFSLSTLLFNSILFS